LRNIGYAAASVVAIELIFWAYSSILKFIIQTVIVNMPLIWMIVIFLFLGGLIFGFIKLIGLGLTTLYGYVCRIATNQKFVIVWTEIWAVVGVAGNCFRLWSTSDFLLQGFMGIIGLVVISVNLGFLAVSLCRSTIEKINENEWDL